VDVIGGQYFSSGNAGFQVSGGLTNLQNLPFIPSFNALNMVAGQNVDLTATTLVSSGGFPYTPASSITLIPRTIDGAVTAASSSGNFTDYTVSLASYDLFPTRAVPTGADYASQQSQPGGSVGRQ
jgi:hypothetical protein